MVAEIDLNFNINKNPYWWDIAPRISCVETLLPGRIDVAIVGSGYTGLVAAITLARAGRSVVVLDAEAPGHGASTRNAGFVGRALKDDFTDLIARHGLAFARRAYEEVWAAYAFVFQLVESESIPCHLERCGRFIPVFSQRQYDKLARELEVRNRYLDDPFEMVPKAEQHRFLGTDLYHGGSYGPERGAIHPGLYHQGLLERAAGAGATIVGWTPVTGVANDGKEVIVATTRGNVRARDVLVATNGYTGSASPWLRRRVVPFHGFMIATEPLAPEVIARALPQPRIVEDYRTNIDFVRRSPDGTRVLFGGRTGGPARDLGAKAQRLRECLVRLFPDLAGARISHAWTGRCAATFDSMPHIGLRDGVRYAMGFNYMGIPMGTWLGYKAALGILGRADAATAFDGRPFPTRVFYRGQPWFVPAVMAYYDWKDRAAV